jgi:hypothetical protein
MSEPKATPKTGKERMADYCLRMRAKGYKPVQR